MLPSKCIQIGQNWDRSFNDSAVVQILDTNWVSIFEGDLDVLGFVRGILWINADVEHFWRGYGSRVLQDSRLVTAMQHVLVHAPRCFGSAWDGDASFGSVRHQVGAALEAIVEFGISPRSYNFDIWLKRVVCELKANLIVSFASGSVSNIPAVLFVANFDLLLGDARSGNRGAEEIPTFVNGVRFDCRKNKICNELLLHVLYINSASSNGKSLFPCSLKVFLLAEVCNHAHNVEILLQKPFENARGIKASAVGETNSFFSHLAFGVRTGSQTWQQKLAQI
mmetsp:Transcript_6115/g.10567  ORF Transcript_6115/g.10567 Transcript_6115/m.10567 type:complete len:280 (-) Transcript_6115:39-878(-)